LKERPIVHDPKQSGSTRYWEKSGGDEAAGKKSERKTVRRYKVLLLSLRVRDRNMPNFLCVKEI
jgi:hypothetical protein